MKIEDFSYVRKIANAYNTSNKADQIVYKGIMEGFSKGVDIAKHLKESASLELKKLTPKQLNELINADPSLTKAEKEHLSKLREQLAGKTKEELEKELEEKIKWRGP